MNAFASVSYGTLGTDANRPRGMPAITCLKARPTETSSPSSASARPL